MQYRLQQMSRIVFRNLREILTVQMINVVFAMIFMEPFASNLIQKANAITSGIVLIDMPGFKLYAQSFMIYLLVILILGLYYTLQISIYIQLFQQIVHDDSFRLKNVFVDALKTQFVKASKQKVILWLLVTLFVPFSFFNIFNMAILPIRIPLFVLDVLLEYRILRMLYLVLSVLVNVISILLVLVTFEVHVNEQKTLKSFRIIYEKLRRDPKETKDIIISIITIACGFFVIYAFLGLALATAHKALIVDVSLASYEFHYSYRIFQFIVIFIAGVLFFSSIVLIAHYLNLDLDDSSVIALSDRPLYVNVMYSLILFVALAFLSDVKAVHFSGNVEIYAHRGAEYGYPENTLPAFDYVLDLGIDGIELDIQKIKSGEFIVTHDANFKRVSRQNLKVNEATYPEVQRLHAGEYLNHYYQGYPARIPLFEDVLHYSESMNLMIEVKTYDQEEKNMAEIVKLLEENADLNKIQVASMSKESLRIVKELNPNIETTFIKTNINKADLDADYIDNYSFQIDFLNLETVIDLQNKGKKVFVWTLNTKSSVRKALNLQVDGIISDDPLMVKETIKDPNYNLGSHFWDWLVFQ